MTKFPVTAPEASARAVIRGVCFSLPTVRRNHMQNRQIGNPQTDPDSVLLEVVRPDEVSRVAAPLQWAYAANSDIALVAVAKRSESSEPTEPEGIRTGARTSHHTRIRRRQDSTVSRGK